MDMEQMIEDENIPKHDCEFYNTFSIDIMSSDKNRFVSVNELLKVMRKYADNFKRDKRPVIDATMNTSNFIMTSPLNIYTEMLKLSIDVDMTDEKYFNVFLTRKSIELKQIVQSMKKICNLSNKELFDILVPQIMGFACKEKLFSLLEPVLISYLNERVFLKPIQKPLCFVVDTVESAIMYLLNSLKYNNIIKPGDIIGVISPIDTVYLESPIVENYGLHPTCIYMEGEYIPEAEIQKITDTRMKLLFTVNPSSSTTLSISLQSLNRVKAVMKASNPNLIIISECSYTPFKHTRINDFMTVIPRNTISIFSMTPYFNLESIGGTAIIMSELNVIDRVLLEMMSTKEVINRYLSVDTDVTSLRFMDRVMADSRLTFGCASLPSNIQVLLSIYLLCDMNDKNGVYRDTIQNELVDRMISLLQPFRCVETIDNSDIGIPFVANINIIKLANGMMDNSKLFSEFIQDNYTPFDILFMLINKYRVMIMPAIVFNGGYWDFRVSLRSLCVDECIMVGEALFGVLSEIYDRYVSETSKQIRKRIAGK